MNLTRFVVAAVLVALSFPSAARAQDPPAPEAPRSQAPKVPSNQNVRVDVTISLKGEAKPLIKNLSMVAGDGKSTKARAGIEIPVPNQPMVITGSPTPAPIGYNYRSVGVNVDASPRIVDATHVMVRFQWQFSTVYKPEQGATPPPSFGTGSHEVDGIVFESGTPLIVTQAVDGETGREYSVQVTATILK
jgi:hypothetical protein